MKALNVYDATTSSFTEIRTAVATFLILFNARRGGDFKSINGMKL